MKNNCISLLSNWLNQQGQQYQFKSKLTKKMEQQTQITDKKNQNNRVKVAIRIRPFIERQKMLHDNSCIQVISNTQIILGNEKLFKFDQVLDENSQQVEVFDSCVKDLVEKCFQGYNSAILAYGQTGSGKTYTMGTTSSRKISFEERGILPRVIENIFENIQRNSSKYKYSIKATFLQIYNQHIIDLLSEDHSSKNNKENNTISIREQKEGSVTIYGANQQKVFKVQDMLELLDRGSFHRTTSSTLMNEASSRSHAIFTIIIERNSVDFKHEQGIDENYITSKFVFVDLAGSERLKKTGATGNTLKEGININLGLLQLGNVISSLAIQKKQEKYINYRNSKLTRILRDSLGGNSNTYMIACVSPAESNYEESLNSIKYASKAMNIKNKPVINRDPQQAHILKLKVIINELQKENIQLKKLLSDRGIDISKYASLMAQRSQTLTSMSESEQISKLKTRISILEKKCEALLIQNKQQTKKSNELEISLYQARRSKDILEIKIEKLLKGESISQDDAVYTPIVESYLNKIQFLQSQIHEKQKSISQLQIQYSKLYDASQRDAIILTKKNEKIFGLERKIKEIEKRLNLSESKQHSQFGERSFQSPQRRASQQYEINEPNDLQSIYEDIDESCLDQLQSQARLQDDSQYLSQVSIHETEHHKLDTQIKNIEKNIQDREAFYADINEQQMSLEYKLIEQMKQQYHQKIRQLQKEREKILTNKRNDNNFSNRSQERTKIQSLQGQLRELKKKAKQQKQLQKQVTNQSNRLKSLNEEINSFKMQKIQLNRKMKEEKDKFNKFKNKRIKELFEAKRENAKKQGQIRKLKNQNKKHLQQAIKRKEEIKRIKKVNETLKQLMKPKKLIRGSLALIPEHASTNGRLTQRGVSLSTSFNNSKRHKAFQQGEISTLSQDQYDSIVSESIKSLLLQIDRELEKQKIIEKCEQIEKQIETLRQQQSALNIKKQRMEIKRQGRVVSSEEIGSYLDLQRQEQEKILIDQLGIKLNEVEERLTNLQEDLEFKSSRYDDLLMSPQATKHFNYETDIIYNKRFQSIQSFRLIITSLYRSIIRLLTQNLHLKQHLDTVLYEKTQLQQEVAKLKEQLFVKNVQCQQKVEQMREQYMELKLQLELERQSRNNDLVELENYSSIGNQTSKIIQPLVNTIQKNQEQLKKKYEKKVEELNKNNKALVKELEVQRKKCEIVTDKYNNLKSLLNKDRFIGITVKEEETLNMPYPQQSQPVHQFNSYQSYRQRRQLQSINKQPTPQQQFPEMINNQIHQSTEEILSTSIIQQKDREQFFNQTRMKRQMREVYDGIQRNSAQLHDLEFNKNSWELAAEITNAHKSPILSLTAYDNILASSASKSVVLWDLENNKLIHQLSGNANPTFVKSVIIHPERQIMFTTADRNINVWDLRTFRLEMVLKGHKDEIRLLHINSDTLFSAGKGTVNGGSLLVWDLRGSMSFENIVQKQRNQDIFSMTSQDGILYYGTRDHFVRRMKIQNNETLLAFQPPHMDTVTGLATFGDYLISGSKDKNLRLWSLQSSMYNLKSTVHSFNEYITCVQNDDYLPLFYASDRSGQIKVGTVINEKIQFVGGILGHSQQINAICKLNVSPRRGLFATGSSDKSIKMWRPSGQTLEHIQNDF